MTECEVFSLSSLIEDLGDDEVSEILSEFHSLYDNDVQTFLREKAIVQEKKQISKTYLIFDINVKELVAYFSIAISSIDAAGIECSNNFRKKLNISNDEIIQSYLIGQVGRDSKSEPGIGK